MPQLPAGGRRPVLRPRGVPGRRIERAGETTRWPTSERVDRLSCARCGTPVFAEPKDPPARLGVALATLDDPGALVPEAHIWVSEKLAWLTGHDGLPQFPKRAP